MNNKLVKNCIAVHLQISPKFKHLPKIRK